MSKVSKWRPENPYPDHRSYVMQREAWEEGVSATLKKVVERLQEEGCKSGLGVWHSTIEIGWCIPIGVWQELMEEMQE